MSDWRLELRRTEWVLWGYGPRSATVYVAPATIWLPEMDLTIRFQLPGPIADLPPPEEYERKVRWGWRFTADLIHTCGWRLAETKEQAIADAKAWALETSESFPKANFTICEECS